MELDSFTPERPRLEAKHRIERKTPLTRESPLASLPEALRDKVAMKALADKVTKYFPHIKRTGIPAAKIPELPAIIAPPESGMRTFSPPAYFKTSDLSIMPRSALESFPKSVDSSSALDASTDLRLEHPVPIPALELDKRSAKEFPFQIRPSSLNSPPGIRNYEWKRGTDLSSLDIYRSKVVELLKDREISIRIDPWGFNHVIDEGYFKTQFETQTSNGWFDPEQRSGFELTHLGVPPQTVPGERPIYGYLAPKDDAKARHTASFYGDIQVVLSHSVKERSSITVGDSLGNGLSPAPLQMAEKR